MPSGIKLKWTGKKCWKFAQKNNVNKMEKAGSFIHKPIYSSKATVAEERKKCQRRKKKTLNLLNSTIQQRRLFLLHYALLRHNRNFLNILYMPLHCFVSPPVQASTKGRWAPFKRKQSIAERWKSQRGSVLACECSPASLGLPSCVCVCVSFCVHGCVCAWAVCMHMSISACIYV